MESPVHAESSAGIIQKFGSLSCQGFVPDPDGRRPLTGKRQKSKEKGFVLETGGRAILAFLGDSAEQAKELCSQDWFAEELASYRSCGHPIWDGKAELSIRSANPTETAELQITRANERARKEYAGKSLCRHRS